MLSTFHFLVTITTVLRASGLLSQTKSERRIWVQIVYLGGAPRKHEREGRRVGGKQGPLMSSPYGGFLELHPNMETLRWSHLRMVPGREKDISPHLILRGLRSLLGF